MTITLWQLGAALAGIIILAALVRMIYTIRAGKLKGFWNDRDGVTITDFLAVVFAAAYMLVSWFLIDKLRNGSLTDQDVDFFEVYSWAMLTILGGYFLDRTAGSVMDKLPHRRNKPPQEPQPTPTEGNEIP